MKNTFYVIALSLTLMACGGSSSSGGSDGSSGADVDKDKDLFSLWKRADGGMPVDFTEGDFRVGLGFGVYLSDGAECSCDLTFIGDQESGGYTLNSCSHVYGTGSSDEAPNCNALDHSGTYSKTTTQLTICDDTQDCTIYN